MPRIPNIVSEPIRTGLPNSGNPAMGTPDAFGAGIGEAITRSGRETMASGREQAASSIALGASIVGAGVAAGNLAQQIGKKEDDAATASGIANFDFTKDYIELQKNDPNDGTTYQERVANSYDEKVNTYVEGMPNDEVRNRVRNQLITQRKGYVEAAAQFQDRQRVEGDKLQADAGLMTLENGVRADGSIDKYNENLLKGNAVIDSRPGLTPLAKEAMKKGYAERLALRRFEGLVSAASADPEALGALEGELTVEGSPWKERMSPGAFDRTLDKIVTLRKSANSHESTAARNVISSFTQRNNDPTVLIPDEELAIGQETVERSKNPALLSQFAMIRKTQSIYREHRSLPIEQQREKIEAMKKSKGIEALPAPVKLGVEQGSALTNGAIGPEYLAGLINVEYAGQLASGDYGKGTGHRNADGTPSSDAVGVAQFISSTWLSVIKKHADTLGVDVAGKSDAQLLEMRKDPTLSLKAAALHAADNKRTLEASLGRPVNDSDLFFSHFLGVGGAERFLTAATQYPKAPATTSVDPKQVAANRPVFYDEAGRVRTNEQVRGFIANATMNGPSRVDYAGVKAGERVLAATEKGVRDDAITFVGTTGAFGPVGDISTPEGMARRGVVAGQVAEFYRVPSKDFKPFTKDEAEVLTKRTRDGTAEETLAVMQAIQGLGNPDMVKAAYKQIGEKDSLFGYAAGLSHNIPTQKSVAVDIIRGEKRLKADKDLSTTLGATEPERITMFNAIVGKAVYGFDPTDGSATTLRKAADALYAERFLAGGDARQGSLKPADYNAAIQLVLGGGASTGGKAIDNVNGKPMVLPTGVSGDEFSTALSRMGDNDYTASSVFGGAPKYRDGTTAKAAEIAREGVFVSIGGGQYVIRMADGKELISAIYKDGSSSRYVFRANPQILRDIASRPAPHNPLDGSGIVDGALTHDGYPARQNADGSHSTEVSITVTNPKLNGGKPTNIPSLWGGKEVPEEEAVTRAVKSGKSYPSYESIDAAVAAAKARSSGGGANSR